MTHQLPAHAWPVEELQMGARPYNILKRMDVHTLGDLSNVTSDEVASWAARNQWCSLGDHDYANIHQQVERSKSILRGESV